MKIIELKNFIKTGRFDSIEVGMSTKQDVIDLMGDDFDFGDFGESHIIKYAWYEFFYWTKTQQIYGIQNDHLQFDHPYHKDAIQFQNSKVQIDNWFLKVNKNITYSEVTEILKTEGIEYSLDKASYNGALEYIKLSNGITFDFDNDVIIRTYDQSKKEWNVEQLDVKNQEDYFLNGIRLFRY